MDAFIEAKTKALHVLDEANKAKNHAYGIDNKHSATAEFLSKLISAKIQASSGSVGPVVNSATTFLTSAKSGVTGALVNKFAPLSSLSSGLVGGLSNGSGGSGGGGGGGITPNHYYYDNQAHYHPHQISYYDYNHEPLYDHHHYNNYYYY